MSSRARLVVVGAVVVALAGVVLWRCRGVDAPAPIDAAKQVTLTKARLRLRDLARQPHGSIAGKVTTAGAPVGGALVCTKSGDDIRCVATAATGEYLLGDLRAGAYELWASAAGLAGTRWKDRDGDRLQLAAGAKRSGIDLVLEASGGEVSGRVRDTRGKVVGGALVHVHVDGDPVATTRSEVDGAFRARVIATTASVRASADGYVDASADTVVPSGGLELELLPEATLSGIVVEAGTRTPVADARVWVSGNVITDDRGKFRATKLRPGRYKPTVRAIGGYGEAAESVLLRVGQRVEGVVIEVHPVSVVAGRIAIEGSATGCPEGDGNVQLERRGSRDYAFGTTIAEGDVLIEGVVPGSYAVRLDCAGYLSAPSYPDLVVGTSDVEDIVWTVKPGATLTGRVIAKGSGPVADALVTVSAGMLGRGTRVRTGADGTFVATGISPGEVEVRAAAVGYVASDEVTVKTELGKAASIELVLKDKDGALAGTVIDRAGRPVAGARVEIRSGDSTAGPSVSTDTRGEFLLQGLDPGPYIAVVESRWQLPATSTTASRVLGPAVRAAVARGVTTRVQLQIDTEGSRISGTVLDSRGDPVPDVAIDVALTSPELEPRRRDWERTLAWTSATGGFVVDKLPDHAVAVRAQIEGADEVVVDNVAPGQHVQLRFSPTGTLAGMVADPSGAVVDDVAIELEDRGQDISRKERLFHTAGKFVFRELPAGTYRITADEDRQTSITVTLPAGGARTDLALVLRERHAIKGRLVAADRRPLAGWKVEVPHKKQPETTGTRTVTLYDVEYAVTDARGEFMIEGLVGAEVTISAGDLAGAADVSTTEVKTVQLIGPPVIDLGDVVVPKSAP